MIRSPRIILLLCLLFFLLSGLSLDFLHSKLTSLPLAQFDSYISSQDPVFSLARYYWNIGTYEKAIQEFQRVIETLPSDKIDSSYNELSQLVSFETSSLAKILGSAIYFCWLLPPKLYGLAIFFALVLIIYCFFQLFKKEPLFLIQSFDDYSGLKLGNDLPRAAIDRIHEIIWRGHNLQKDSKFIADSVELPVLSLVSEGDNRRSVEILETALRFSLGSSNLPLSYIISEIKLWLQHPHYLVRGTLTKQESSINLKMLLYDQKRQTIEEEWCIDIAGDGIPIARIVDAVIFPLLFHFRKHVSASRWEALRALQNGLEEFQLFRNDTSLLTHRELAQKQLRYALELDPDYDLAKYNLALLLLADGKIEESKRYFKEISVSSSNHELRTKARYNYGVALILVTQDWAFEKAALIFQDLKDQINNESLHILIRSMLAITYGKMASRSENQKQKLIDLCNIESNSVLEAFQDHKAKGKNPLRSIETKEAVANAFSAKGFALMASEKYDLAIDQFKSSLTVYPTNSTSLLGLADAYYYCGQNENAQRNYQKAALQSPNHEYVWYRLGSLYNESAERDRAVEALKKAPGIAYAHLILGKIHFEEKNYEMALEEFKQAAGLNNHLPDAWANVASTILQMNSESLLKEALAAARRALQIEKNDKFLWHHHAIMASCHFHLGDFEKAEKEACKAVELGGDQAQAYFCLGQVQCQLGRIQDARASLQKAIGLDKTGSWKTAAIDLLHSMK